jgi:hypothetical protein
MRHINGLAGHDYKLDVLLCVLAQALLAAFRNRLGPGCATA